eukprot:COSAG05_NODE_6148_length_1012_cov_4.219622_1_plen_71_part_00
MIEVPVYMLLMRCRRGLANSVSRVTIDLLVQKFRTGSELMSIWLAVLAEVGTYQQRRHLHAATGVFPYNQ